MVLGQEKATLQLFLVVAARLGAMASLESRTEDLHFAGKLVAL